MRIYWVNKWAFQTIRMMSKLRVERNYKLVVSIFNVIQRVNDSHEK